MKPIEIWSEIIRSQTANEDISERLEEIYRNNRPHIAEIVMNSRCSGRCIHCIYAPDYEQYNKNLRRDEWEAVLRLIHNKLGLKKFIFDGRALTEECIQAIRFLRNRYRDVMVGLITDGVSVQPFIEELADCPPDWIDISVDGQEKDHDRQRNHEGSYRKTIEALMQLKEAGCFRKISILTCLTTINIGSISQMVRSLNVMGFKNFFITPVSILEGYRPDPALRPGREAFVRWLDELLKTAESLADSWVELDVYDALYLGAIKDLRPGLFDTLLMGDEHLEAIQNNGDNEAHICYYPPSLTGIRELIINSDGNIIPPKVMAMGRIPKDLVVGNILLEHFEDWSFLGNPLAKKALSVFKEELMEEKRILGPSS